MWTIFEHRKLSKQLSKVPAEILARYEIWKSIVEISGPEGLRAIKGFKDESLQGEWKGFRSSRLNIQYRVIYQIRDKELFVNVVEVTPHDYKRKS
ncbi:MAG TPA: type II toxin-antitoxin system mRNA interferase toxin, RelE/StbE family [Cellvibrio sp.]|uniref:type II toxin-antitoxin system mRNA interferase toxin, RelE/StbE family n=1 Tax=Cellvibrio sp. TaxID=1965322 RepID=UPI000EE8ECD7|nr:type II toxin-antitoxin system mRNA interferase toxin, RelE/StbE family [Cellvibrio sp.]HCS63766.1 type II toxin-antitoxin system mRNA interferase toxin, RelE/StbE family [Cellvibrio sp.]